MPVTPKALRLALATAAILLFTVVLGFYAYARYRIHKAIHDIPSKLNIDVQQSANGFKISKSEGGRTLFTISASKAVQFKSTQRVSLSDARILIFNSGQGTTGSASDIYDQIYGKQFEYDQASGEVTAAGVVLIDLQATGKPAENPIGASAQPGAIHLKTTGLSFNQKTGIARTDQEIDFALPQAAGSATGAVYDSKKLTIDLKSRVNLRTSSSAASHGNNFGNVDIAADQATISDSPRRAILSHVRLLERKQRRTVTADQVQVDLRGDNTVDSVLASGNVEARTDAPNPTQLRASQAELTFAAGSSIKNAVLSGRVNLDSQGSNPMHASAGRAVIDFTGKNLIGKIHASEAVHVVQQKSPSSAAKVANSQMQGIEVDSQALDLFMQHGNRLEKAVTGGAARIVLDQNASPAGPSGKAPSRTTVTANRFEATFASGQKARLQSIRGIGNAKIVSSTSGAPDRVTTSRELEARFDSLTGGITSAIQKGDFKYSEGQRSGTADTAKFNTVADTFILTGSARLQDATQGLSLTANSIQLKRKNNTVDAQGSVKSTYNQLKPDQNGAILAAQGHDPIHVTAASMTASQVSGTARYNGGARLWQGANLIQAPQIVFDKSRRTLEATAAANSGQVETVFVQTDKSGKSTPVTVTASRLTYSDNDRKARFEGGVKVKGAETTLTANHADILLKAKNSAKNAAHESASQVDRITAQGDIVIEQQHPHRRAIGSDLIYTASDGKFVLTGSKDKFPSIFDAERGNITGNSLTFFSHDDRVQVGSGPATRTVTRTRLKEETKP